MCCAKDSPQGGRRGRHGSAVYGCARLCAGDPDADPVGVELLLQTINVPAFVVNKYWDLLD